MSKKCIRTDFEAPSTYTTYNYIIPKAIVLRLEIQIDQVRKLSCPINLID
jgi:hypothetical protein